MTFYWVDWWSIPVWINYKLKDDRQLSIAKWHIFFSRQLRPTQFPPSLLAPSPNPIYMPFSYCQKALTHVRCQAQFKEASMIKSSSRTTWIKLKRWKKNFSLSLTHNTTNNTMKQRHYWNIVSFSLHFRFFFFTLLTLTAKLIKLIYFVRYRQLILLLFFILTL